MKTRRSSLSGGRLFVALVAIALGSGEAQAQARKGRPVSKVYVSDVSGEAQIYTGEVIEDLSKRAVYSVQGTVIETKKSDQEGAARNYSTMVYSNGTGAFFDANTRVEVNRFVQEPFRPNRTDVEVEPSISQTQAYMVRGIVGLCTSKLVAGSVMTYQTPHGSVNIRGRKIVIQTSDDFTKISMLEGDSIVRAGTLDLGGHTIRTGEQAIIRRAGQGQPNQVEIARIPSHEMPQLDDKVAMACLARRTVYFDVREPDDGGAGSADGEASDAGGPGGPVTAFDAPGNGIGSGELVPIEVVPVNLPVQFTISPATLTTPGRGSPSG